VTSTKDEAHQVKEIMRLNGSELIKEQLGRYIGDLKTEFSQGMILPSAKNPGNESAVKPVNTNKQVSRP
jgi:heme oxygenase